MPDPKGDASIHGITLKGNQATYGGGLYNDDVMTLTGSSFTNNSAVYGGGMYNEDEATVDGTSFQREHRVHGRRWHLRGRQLCAPVQQPGHVQPRALR